MTLPGGRSRRTTLSLDGVDELGLEVDAAHLTVVPVTPGDGAALDVAGQDADLIAPRVTTPSGGTRLSVDLRPTVPPPAGHWRVEVVARVPRDIALVLHMQGGAVAITGIELRALNVEMLAGQVGLVDVATALNVSTTAGQVTGRGLRGSLDVSTVAGQIDLEIADLAAGEHRVQSEVGAIRVAVRPGLEVRVEARVGVGVVLGAIPSVARAAAVLRVESKAGTIQLGTALPT